MFEKNVKAQLILDNGTVFHGKAFGHITETIGEVVFTTSMAGYQETLTDPTYAGQIVTMTYPLIGNYGTNLEDMESVAPRLKGLIVREKCAKPSNWRCEMELEGFLKQYKIMGLEGIDTRALTKMIRNEGTGKGIITTRFLSSSQVSEKFNSFGAKNLVRECTTPKKYVLEGDGLHIAVIDLGAKRSELSQFQKNGCKLTVFPGFTEVEEILSVNPDGIYLSAGPGGPQDIPFIVETVKQFIGKRPISGSGLGHLVIAQALGCEIQRLKFGHHGASYPVKNMENGKVLISAQNQCYGIQQTTDELDTIFKNIHDGTVEGVKHKTLPIISVQFYPNEAMVQKFISVMKGGMVNA